MARPGKNRGQHSLGKPKDVRKTMVRLFSYLEKDRGKLFLVLVCVLITVASSLGGSYMLRPVINGLTSGNGSMAFLLRSILLMAAIFAAGIMSQYLQARIMISVGQDALQRLRHDLFVKTQSLPVRFFDANNHGDIMSRFTNDVDAIGEMLNSTLVQVITGTVSIAGTFFLMLYTNLYLTVVTVVMIPVMLKAGQGVAGRSRKYYQAQQAALGELNG